MNPGRRLWALDADDFESCQHHLFDAAPYYMGACAVFDLLRETCEDRSTLYKRCAVNDCEEKIVRIADSLRCALFNLDGNLLGQHKCEVAEARKKNRLAAEQLISEYIELRFLYPRSYRNVFARE